MNNISETILALPNEFHIGVMERRSPTIWSLIVWRWMMYIGGRTKGIGRSKSLKRYSGIQVGWREVLTRCTVTCLSGLNGSTGTWGHPKTSDIYSCYVRYLGCLGFSRLSCSHHSWGSVGSIPTTRTPIQIISIVMGNQYPLQENWFIVPS